MYRKYRQIHFVGIGGAGMSGIAEVLLNLGYEVSGSDVKHGEATRRLIKQGAQVRRGHARAHLNGADVVVVSSAVSRDNPEVQAAIERGIPVVPRAEMLAELMRLKWGIAVAGTHGKTTTTAMIATVLSRAGLDPTVVNGGKVLSMRTNARLGRGDFLVAEADESDRSFLKLSPTIGVVTNIDPEHLENYRGQRHQEQAFLDFANKVPFYGAVVACRDHPAVRRLIARCERRVITYGTQDSDYEARTIIQSDGILSFDVWHRGKQLGTIRMRMSGKHNVLNALAAIAVAREVDISFSCITQALERFTGVSRRFEILYHAGPIVVDDYAHHPVEIAATLDAARARWPERNIVAVMQPHRYSRLAALFKKFVDVMQKADAFLIMDVYSAGEQPSEFTGEKLWISCKSKLSKSKPKTALHTPKKQDVLQALVPWRQSSDVILFLGAGDVTQIAREFARSLTSRSSRREPVRDSSARRKIAS